MGAKMFRPFIVLTPQPMNGQNVLHYLSLSGEFVLLHYPETFMSLEKLDECLPTIRKLTLKSFQKMLKTSNFTCTYSNSSARMENGAN